MVGSVFDAGVGLDVICVGLPAKHFCGVAERSVMMLWCLFHGQGTTGGNLEFTPVDACRIQQECKWIIHRKVSVSRWTYVSHPNNPKKAIADRESPLMLEASLCKTIASAEVL